MSVWSGHQAALAEKCFDPSEVVRMLDNRVHQGARRSTRGPMLPMIWRSIPDLGPSFRELALS
jgi:hypothetical protein